MVAATATVWHYVLFLGLFVLAQSLSMWGQYVTLPHPHLTMWEAYKMAIPFAWMDWFVMTFVVQLGDTYKLVTPTQDTFLLIIIQFALILIINQYYLKQPLTRSDVIAFGIILFGFFVSFFHLYTRTVGWVRVPSWRFGQPWTGVRGEHSSISVQRYRSLA